ncbi:autophagy protein atg27 [Moniliophthora roreri MCA 2997]|uniref:Autophagy-related protein 27 n=1 Tax=Moniliophthora roreri (strain MCA 2997) TaxID=1381753 RepID=V2WZR6_MONRO|nr:autophagy protein atg27 [Moniliophthora roreri MCA 2997]
MSTARAAILVLSCAWMALGLGIRSTSEIPCSFTIQNLKYDICPLLRSGVRHRRLLIPEDTPPTLTTNKYEIGLTGPLKRDATLPQDLQCPDGTWICLTGRNTFSETAATPTEFAHYTVSNMRPNHPSEPERILRVVPIAGGDLDMLRPTFKIINNGKNSTGKLQVALHGGMYNGKKQKAAFMFSCDRSKERAETVGGQLTSPSFSWTFNGTHAFEWRSFYACPEVAGNTDHDDSYPEKGGTDDDEDADSPPADPDSDSEKTEDGSGNGERDNAGNDKPLRDYSGLTLIPIIILLLATLFFIKVYRRIPQGNGLVLFSFSSTPSWSKTSWQVRKWLGRRLKLGKSDYEALGSSSDEDPGNESGQDYMRKYESFYAVYGQAGTGIGEGEDIPLTPSPRRSTFGYGTSSIPSK